MFLKGDNESSKCISLHIDEHSNLLFLIICGEKITKMTIKPVNLPVVVIQVFGFSHNANKNQSQMLCKSEL